MDTYKRSDYSRLAIAEVFERLDSRPEGLSAAQAHTRLRDHGSNLVEAKKSRLLLVPGPFAVYIRAVLIVAAALSLFLDNGGKIAIILLLVALLNAVFDLILRRCGNTVHKNASSLQAAQAHVLRGGKEQTVPAAELVLGDVILLQPNDVVPADARIFDEDNIIIDESAFTAQHTSVRKFAHTLIREVAPMQRHNLALAGSSVISGTARAVVTATGNHTELGRAVHLAATSAGARPTIKTRLNTLFAACFVLLALILGITAMLAGFTVQTTLFFAVCLLVALTPTALLPVKAANLAATVSRLAKANVRLTKLSAVSNLGRCQVLLYDTASEALPECAVFHELLMGKTTYTVESSGLTSKGKAVSASKLKDMSLLFTTAGLSSGHGITAPDKALNALATLGKIDATKVQNAHEAYKLFPYDAGRRMHSSVRHYNGQTFVFVQGAIDAVLAESTELWDQGHVRRLLKADREVFTKFHAAHANAGSQTIALAYRVLPAKTSPHDITPETAEAKLTLLGVAAMATPLQSVLPTMLQAAARTKLPVAFIADAPPAAAAAAIEAVLPALQHPLTILTSDDILHASDDHLSSVVLRGDALFSQITPEDKLRLVEILQRNGLAVAVSGDGLYDAPALARADVGIAGNRSDVSGAADMLLHGQGFEGLLGALDISRQTRQNFTAMLRCMLTTTAGKLSLVLLSLFGTALFHVPAVIGIIPLLAIDILVLAFPLAGLSWDTPHARPASPHNLQALFTREAFSNYGKFGLLAAALAYLSFLAYFVYSNVSPQYIDGGNNLHINAATLAFLTFALCESINVLFVRRAHSAEASRHVLLGFVCAFLCVLTLIYNPVVHPFSGTTDLSGIDWLIALVAGLLYFAARLVQRHTAKHTRREVLKLHQEIHGHNSPARV